MGDEEKEEESVLIFEEGKQFRVAGSLAVWSQIPTVKFVGFDVINL
jgi:hypothetical protein